METTEDLNEVEISPEITGLLLEYRTAGEHVDAEVGRALERLEQLRKTREAISGNTQGTVRAIVRAKKLNGNWVPSEDGTKLLKVPDGMAGNA